MSDTAKQTILVVDDEALLALELEMILKEAGYRVLGPAHSIDRALKLIEGEPPDGAVLDVNLGTGRSDPIADLLAEMGVPYLFLSGHARDVLGERHRDRTLVSKPYREAELLAAVAALGSSGDARG
ncbi:response regulator [Wenxinia marina]|uniref:Response regulator n=1 Tax=Wenxinia marina DSM 24838 TaxID=1123501 RepID=A0A0D0Q2U0_9RHOB|nr:response regulator [Wenxinia marina]KIQ68864.1 Response regulator [Wenxinia marina DSM 24838]GGL64616.1 response regulator [Wenxinia marina]